MKRFVKALSLVIATAALFSGSANAAEFEKYEIETASASLSTTQAGAHADFTTDLRLSEKESRAYAKTENVVVRLPPGLVGNPAQFPTCSTLELGTTPQSSECPQSSQVGSTDVTISGVLNGIFQNQPIYNMPPPAGSAARFGFFAGGFPIFLDARLDPQTDGIVATVEGLPSAAELIEAKTRFWGIPSSPAHDLERLTPQEAFENNGPPSGRKADFPEVPFMTNPTSCGQERHVTFTLTSYQLPGQVRTRTVPFPAITGCGALSFNPTATLAPTTTQATSGTGLDYELSLPTKGLEFGNLNFGSELRRAEVVLPEGMTINPAEAADLGVCTEEDLARETYSSPPGAGCPETSKIGTVEARTPVIDRKPTGSLYLAKPYENPFGSLLGLYMVLKAPERGVMVKVAGEVRTDPVSGQITTVFDDIPELPVATFHLHFIEAARSPLVTPPACGTYTGVSKLGPWSDPAGETTRTSDFAIESGPDHGPCPSGGLPPFRPHLLAGTLNNAAGSFSPFYLRLSRTDAEQEITHFSIKLPPGLSARLAGVPFCPEPSIAGATARKGPHGGEEESSSPSCPAASQIGTTWVGAGV
ncbi:MAG TPA: hypothetical protein VNC15_00600, partial [Solirubrobacterales bacterium]|nr:hypothetical protein [Solirubrobacterales bacterium]